MDHIPVKESEIVIDIESCVSLSKELINLDILDNQLGKTVSFTVCGMPMIVDELANGQVAVSLPSNTKNVGDVSPDSGKNARMDNRKSMSAKKPPKPPRPPTGLSLDAADQKLIKEITELAMIKRARIERMKALKKMKASKTSSVSASSIGNLIATLFTVLFCIVIIFQGCHSSGMSQRNSSTIRIHGSPETNSAADGNAIVIKNQQNLSTSNAPLTDIGSPYLMELAPDSDSKHEEKRTVYQI